MPTSDKVLEVVKIYYGVFWDEVVKRTSKFVTPRSTDVPDDAAGDKTFYMSHLILISVNNRQQKDIDHPIDACAKGINLM